IDEPMVGLDPKSMRLVKDILSRRAEEKTTIVMSTHTLTLAEEISHRIGIIHKGRLIRQGTVQEIKNQARESEKLEDIFLKMTEEDL
ncbi:MAG: ABC transporter ATP-binding protein, partial [Syntrophaceae bacterium]|nr:ABC transporter ATP-binding protein [Syntrophaceae bacterium]